MDITIHYSRKDSCSCQDRRAYRTPVNRTGEDSAIVGNVLAFGRDFICFCADPGTIESTSERYSARTVDNLEIAEVAHVRLTKTRRKASACCARRRRPRPAGISDGQSQ